MRPLSFGAAAVSFSARSSPRVALAMPRLIPAIVAPWIVRVRNSRRRMRAPPSRTERRIRCCGSLAARVDLADRFVDFARGELAVRPQRFLEAFGVGRGVLLRERGP